MALMCKVCGVNNSRATRIYQPEDCMRGEDVQDGADMCAGMRLMLTEMALRRAVCPEAFDTNGRIKTAQLGFAVEAQNKAIEQQKRVFGPTLIKGE